MDQDRIEMCPSHANSKIKTIYSDISYATRSMLIPVLWKKYGDWWVLRYSETTEAQSQNENSSGRRGRLTHFSHKFLVVSMNILW